MTVRMAFGPDSGIGFIGLGSMGAGMAHCLLRNGFRLRVFARDPKACTPFVEAGAQVAASPAELARGCKLVFLSLPDAAAVEDVLFGPEGLSQALEPGSYVVDTSTIAATSARDFGRRLAQYDIALLDAPVSGGQQGAQAGTLTCMVGGATPVVEACREVISTFCKTVTHVGELGAGQTVKLCNQVAVAGAMLGVADAIALAQSQAQGVDMAAMREVLMGGSAKSFSLEKHAPRIIARDFKPGFRAALMRKDLRLALDMAHATSTVLPCATVAHQLLDELCAGGGSDLDWCAVAVQANKPA